MMQLINDQTSKPFNPMRSLICDNNGIIIAETVYRCMFCSIIFDSLEYVQAHYYTDHFEEPILRTHQEESLSGEVIDYDNDDFDEHTNDVFIGNGRSLSISSEDNGDMQSSKSFETDLGLISTQSISVGKVNGTTKGGLVTCEVCGLTKYYSHISRRYGVFSCESCAKFFYRYCQKPVHYICSNNGNCSLKVDSPGGRCKSCLLNACLKKYVLDPKKHSKVIEKHFPNSGISDNVDSLTDETSKDNSELNSKRQDEIENSREKKKKQKLSKRKTENSMKLSKYRRMPCKTCESCVADDCGFCLYCLDKPKFGGNDVKKQKCLRRRCRLLK